MKPLRQFINDEQAVGFLIFYILAAMFVFGATYAIVSDIRDFIGVEIWDALSPMGGDLNDSEALYGFDFINFLLSFSITFFIIALMWYSKQMAQKPEQPY